MGKECSKCKGHSNSHRNIKLLMLGLDNAGKTTAARHYLGKSLEDMVPTVGFSTMKFRHRRFEVEVFDLGGNKNIRGIWKNYYALVHGIVFVVDSTDKDRLEECRNILNSIIQNPKVSKKPFLLLVNKQDKESALNEFELCGIIEIEKLVNKHECPTRVETSIASIQLKKQKDKGIEKGFHWLISLIIQNFQTLNTRVENESQEQHKAEEKERKERFERVRRVREERESGECALPNEIKDETETKEQKNGNPFRPVSDILAETQVRDSSERKLSVGGSRSNEKMGTTSANLVSSVSNENITEKSSSKKKKKLFKNKISPSAPDLSVISPNKLLELPPIRSLDTTDDILQQKAQGEHLRETKRLSAHNSSMNDLLEKNIPGD